MHWLNLQNFSQHFQLTMCVFRIYFNFVSKYFEDEYTQFSGTLNSVPEDFRKAILLCIEPKFSFNETIKEIQVGQSSSYINGTLFFFLSENTWKGTD